MSLLDDLAASDGSSGRNDPRRTKQAHREAKRDARSGIPATPSAPKLPPFVEMCVNDLVKEVSQERVRYLAEAAPFLSTIAENGQAIAEDDEQVRILTKLLGEIPPARDVEDATEAYRIDMERTRIARPLARRAAGRAARSAALEAAAMQEARCFEDYRARQKARQAEFAAVALQYKAELLRRHPSARQLETTLPPVMDAAFARARRLLNDADQAVRTGLRSTGPNPEE